MTPTAPHLFPDEHVEPLADPAELGIPAHTPKVWRPRRVLITKDAREWPLAGQIAERATAAGAEVIELSGNQIRGLRGETDRETYALAKTTMAVVLRPASKAKLDPIPPSADWRVDLAVGCPAHCQYCYLAGSLTGPPVTRVYANLPEILGGLEPYAFHAERRPEEGTTFECSCYTDPLAMEHLTGSVAETVRFFGAWEAPVQLRFTTKFDAVDELLSIDHRGRTRIRFSVNASAITRRFEGGTASLNQRIEALRRCAAAGYPVGLTIAPIMPIEDWREGYALLLQQVRSALAGIAGVDLTVELITHRFTPGSRDVLLSWYPQTKLEMDSESRSQKRTKFGSVKYVFRRDVMTELRTWFSEAIASELPSARVLYWT